MPWNLSKALGEALVIGACLASCPFAAAGEGSDDDVEGPVVACVVKWRDGRWVMPPKCKDTPARTIELTPDMIPVEIPPPPPWFDRGRLLDTPAAVD